MITIIFLDINMLKKDDFFVIELLFVFIFMEKLFYLTENERSVMKVSNLRRNLSFSICTITLSDVNKKLLREKLFLSF